MDNKQYGDELFIYAMALLEEAELTMTETQDGEEEQEVEDE